jgi:hypothetical protein
MKNRDSREPVCTCDACSLQADVCGSWKDGEHVHKDICSDDEFEIANAFAKSELVKERLAGNGKLSPAAPFQSPNPPKTQPFLETPPPPPHPCLRFGQQGRPSDAQ